MSGRRPMLPLHLGRLLHTVIMRSSQSRVKIRPVARAGKKTRRRLAGSWMSRPLAPAWAPRPPAARWIHDARELSCEPAPMSMPTGVRPDRQPGAEEATRIEAEIEPRVLSTRPPPVIEHVTPDVPAGLSPAFLRDRYIAAGGRTLQSADAPRVVAQQQLAGGLRRAQNGPARPGGRRSFAPFVSQEHPQRPHPHLVCTHGRSHGHSRDVRSAYYRASADLAQPPI